MKKIWSSSATFLSFIGILGLTALGYFKDTDVATYIAIIVVGSAGSRAYEATKIPK